MASLAPFCGTLRRAVLQHMRMAPAAATCRVPSAAAALLTGPARSFAETAGTYLDRNEVTERVLNIVKNFEKVDPAKVSPTSSFQKDLGLDSLDTVEVVMAFEEEFAVEIPDNDADKIITCEDAIKYFASHPQAK